MLRLWMVEDFNFFLRWDGKDGTWLVEREVEWGKDLSQIQTLVSHTSTTKVVCNTWRERSISFPFDFCGSKWLFSCHNFKSPVRH